MLWKINDVVNVGMKFLQLQPKYTTIFYFYENFTDDPANSIHLFIHCFSHSTADILFLTRPLAFQWHFCLDHSILHLAHYQSIAGCCVIVEHLFISKQKKTIYPQSPTVITRHWLIAQSNHWLFSGGDCFNPSTFDLYRVHPNCCFSFTGK